MSKTSEEYTIEDILIKIWKLKYVIIVINLIFIIGSISYSLITDEIFEVSCIIRPAQPSEEVTLLESSFFTQFSFTSGKMELPVSKEISSYLYSNLFLKKYYLKYKDKDKSIFDDKLINLENSNLEEPLKSEKMLETALKILKGNVIVLSDNGFLMTISVRGKDKYLAKDFLIEIINDLKIYIQSKNKSILQNQISYYEKVIKKANDPNIIALLQNTINKKIQKSFLISTNIFEIIEEPIIPTKKYWPKRSMIVIASTLFGFVFSLFFVFAYAFILNIYNNIKQK